MISMTYESPEDAERAFYEAFERGDVSAMMSVWAEEEAIVCIHPMGPTLHGRGAVEESWRHMFDGGVPMRVEIKRAEQTHEGTLAIRVVHEKIAYGANFSGRTVVLATNVFKLTDAGWRMIVHHASPTGVPPSDPPAHPSLH